MEDHSFAECTRDKSRTALISSSFFFHHLTVQLTQTPPPRYFPRISMDILLSATSWLYVQDVAWPLQLHISQWKPLPAVPGLHGIWLYMGQHLSHLSPHVWRSHWHSWCWGITRNAAYQMPRNVLRALKITCISSSVREVLRRMHTRSIALDRTLLVYRETALRIYPIFLYFYSDL